MWDQGAPSGGVSHNGGEGKVTEGSRKKSNGRLSGQGTGNDNLLERGKISR